MTVPSIPSIAADRVRRAGEALITAVSTTSEDQLHWKPLELGRPVLNQAIECVGANLRWAGTIRSRTVTEVPEEIIQANRALYRSEIESGSLSGETVKQRLKESSAELADAILAVPDSELMREIVTPEETFRLYECFNHPYWNMVYHLGQINYIQTLYGDREVRSVF